MNLYLAALLQPIDWLVLLIDPRSWAIAALAVFVWRPFYWPRRLLLALAVYLVLAVLIELAFGTFIAEKTYGQFTIGLVATVIWFWLFLRLRSRLADKG